MLRLVFGWSSNHWTNPLFSDTPILELCSFTQTVSSCLLRVPSGVASAFEYAAHRSGRGSTRCALYLEMVASSCRKTGGRPSKIGKTSGITQQTWGYQAPRKRIENRSKIVKIHGPGNLRCYSSDVDLNHPILSPSWPRGFCRFLLSLCVFSSPLNLRARAASI